MAEDEIRKHTKAAIKAFQDNGHNWKHKLMDVLLEVLIIVFAVSISIWFHNWSDELHEDKEEKEFLTGLKSDLKIDIENIKNSRDFYKYTADGMHYFMKAGASDMLNKDSLVKYGNLFFSSTELEPRISRYEALKSSGKLGIIENKELLNDIISLNESVIVRIQTLNGLYQHYIERSSGFIEEHAQLNHDGRMTNVPELIRSTQMRFLLIFGRSSIVNNLIPAHDDGIKECNKIIAEIDKETK